MRLSVALSHRFDGLDLDIRFEAPAGVTALFGPSGCGKTTVVQAVAGLLRTDSHHIQVGERVLSDSATRTWLPPHKRRVGYVFQQDRLFPHLNVRQNLGYGRWFARNRATSDFDQITGLLGIDALLNRRVAGLSGGEKQRISIGRALLAAPSILLMDEPLAALDEARKSEILPYLERLRDETNIPILYVSHAMSEVARLATTVVALNAGKVVRAGPAEEVLSDPASAQALGLRQAGSILTGRLVAQHDDGLSELAVSAGTLYLPRIHAAPGARVRVRIEAQDVMLSRTRPEGLSALNILPATVRAVHAGGGPGVIVQLSAGDDLILARITKRSAAALDIRPGASCYGIVKSVSVAQSNIGAPRRPAGV
jgi:molybdate transport system ATP-binding protein